MLLNWLQIIPLQVNATMSLSIKFQNVCIVCSEKSQKVMSIIYMMSTFPKCFCFLIYQTPPEYENGSTPCSYRQRSSNIYLVNVLLNNRSSLIILGSLHVILYLPFQPACQAHSIGRLHAHMQNTIGGHRAAVLLWASAYAYAYAETHMLWNIQMLGWAHFLWHSALLLSATVQRVILMLQTQPTPHPPAQ